MVDRHVAVLVVGAGPVGLVLACELARRDVPIRVIDKLPAPTDESRAIVVHARSLEMMERIGTVEPLIASGIETTGMEFHADGEVLARLALDTVDSPYPFSISTAQTETERVLTARLTELGVTIEREVELVGLEQDDDEVRSTLRHADGSEETLATGWIAGTDGSHSTVREQVGAKLEGSFKGERFLLGDVEADYDLERTSMHSFLVDDAGPLFLFPMRGSRLRVIAQLDDAAGDVQPTLDRMQEVCDHCAGGIALRSAHWLTIFEIHHAQVPAYRYGRAFLAGDAAHVHSPAAGQGMNTGMQDAFNLGWKLALAASGQAAPGLLDSYGEERHPVAARVIEQTTRMTDIGTVHHELERKLRNHALHLAAALSPIRSRLADQTEEIDVGYRDSEIVGSGRGGRGGPWPGEAAPDVPGLDAPLHRALAAGSGHTALYVAGTDGPTAPLSVDGLRHVLVSDDGAADRGNGSPFDEAIADPERRVAERYGVGHAGGLALVRPDGYIGLRANIGDEYSVKEYLARIVAG